MLQTGAVLARYGNYAKVIYDGCGRSARIVRPPELGAALTAHLSAG